MQRIPALFAAAIITLASSWPALAGQSVYIGVNMELTGYSGDPGTEQYHGALAAHEVAPTISVNGQTYDLEFKVCDNQTQREASANCASRLLGEGVAAVIGGYSSSMSLAAAPIMQKAGVVAISTGSTNPATTGVGDAIFRIPFTDDYQGQAEASYAYNVLGARKAVVFRQADDDYSVGLARVFTQEFTRLGGAVSAQSFNQSTVDFSAQLNNARRQAPDVLVTTAFCPLAGPLVKQSRTLGFAQPWLGGDSLDSPTCVQLGGAAFAGVHFTGFPDLNQLPPDAVARAGAIKSAYADLFPDSQGFGGVTLAGSDAYGVLRQAITDAIKGGADPSDVAAFRIALRDSLAKIQGYPGVTGVLTYAGTDGTPANRSIGLFEVQNVSAGGDYTRADVGYFTIETTGAVYHGGA